MPIIDAFQERHRSAGSPIPDSTMGRGINGEAGLVSRIRQGSSPTLRVAGMILDFMRGKDAELAAAEGGDADHAGGDTAPPAPASPGNGADFSRPVPATSGEVRA